MAGIKDFIHLSLPNPIAAPAKFRKPVIFPQTQTAQNKQNRQLHGNNLKKKATTLSTMWNDRCIERKQQALPNIEGGRPFLLQIDPTADVNFLYAMGFEVVCDLDDGFIVVATDDVNLNTFQQKVDDFVNNKQRSGSPAKVYGLCDDDDRISKILSKNLYEKWSTLDGSIVVTVDLSIECNGLTRNPEMPQMSVKESRDDYNDRCQKALIKYYEDIDKVARERQEKFEHIVSAYNPNQGFEYIDEIDSFSVRITINGAGLRDLVQNFGYIFEVSENTEIKMETTTGTVSQINDTLTVVKPDEKSPIVCVVDSGIQEGHEYLSPAILADESICLIPNDNSVNDEYSRNGTTSGHGTRVAGAILYYNNIPKVGEYVLPCFIRNLRVLDRNNYLPLEINPSQIISDSIKHFVRDATIKSKIFNHSIGGGVPFDGDELKHMSAWAAKIDSVSYDNDVLFIQAAGNITLEVISGLISAGFCYPQYFNEKPARLSNPAQSLQALTVGSISHTNFDSMDVETMGKMNEISSFSRIGPGIWDSIKPDVVEYGGTYAINKNNNTITTPEEVCTDLIRSSPQGPAYAKDGVGTSFAAPKVAHIAVQIQKVLPEAPALLYRALIAQSAQLPCDVSRLTTDEKQMLIRQMGYGLPDIEKATQNNDYRVTLITTESIEISAGEAHIFPVRIPDELLRIGDDYNVLIEITLSYSSKPRRTRRGIKGYMSTWLDWVCSRVNETQDSFEKRVFETDKSVQDDGTFKWAIREQNNWGDFKGFNRKGQTLQKDWCIVKSSQLREAFCIAVRGHKGWGSLFKAKYALAISFEAIDQNIAIYEPMRAKNTIETEVDNSELQVEIKGFSGEVQ